MRIRPVLVVATIYVVVGLATAMLAGSASSIPGRNAWRLAAWVISAAIFLGHLAYAHLRLRLSGRSAATHVAGAVALAVLVLAALGPVRAHWGAPDFKRAALLSLPLWPVLAGGSAFVAALVLSPAFRRFSATRVLPLLVFMAAHAMAQAPASDFAFGRDYTYERLTATRIVHDADDDGSIQLVTQIWKPVRNDRHEVAFFMHGSTGGLASAPNEPGTDGIPRTLVQYLLAHGYTVVAPSRRGRGFSTGHYVEECPIATGGCTRDQQLALTTRGIREAMLDDDAVLDQIVLGKLLPRDGKLLLVGHSRGGFLALVTAAERPALVKGVINFAGSWVNARDEWADYRRWADTNTVRLSRAAKQYAGPTMWIYADRDASYSERFLQDMLRAWRGAGGSAEFLYITGHALPNPHFAFTVPSLWQRQVDAFLAALDARKP